jgi:nicotinate-nucleotide pyrophosphorylase (carboxylating)
MIVGNKSSILHKVQVINNMEGINIEELDKFIIESLDEDVKDGDHTSLACIKPDDRSMARLLVKDIGSICGVDIANYIFQKVDPKSSFTKFIEDGMDIKRGDIAFEVICNSRALLKAERLVLNTMQRLSGITTLSSRFAVEVEDLPVKILDTRKTTPRLRFLEKYAVRTGGCTNYRDGLYDWIMLKDNHIDASGGLTEAIRDVNAYLKKIDRSMGITIEVRNLVELHQVLDEGGVTRIMLDNFELPILKEAVATINGVFETEASGGVTLKKVRKIAETGVDYISTGALTHSAGSLDLSLKVVSST